MAPVRLGRMTAERVLAAIGLAIGTLALVIQFMLLLVTRMELGGSLANAVVDYFSSFSVLANIAAMFVYASSAFPRNRGLETFRQPVVRAMTLGALALVAALYYALFAPASWELNVALGLNLTLHYADPAIYLVWWAIFCTRARLHYRDISSMLIPPLIYLCYVVVRGELVGDYPYAGLNAARLGYGQVALNVIAVLVVLTALCAVVVSLDRAIGRLKR